ncbi:oligopeptide transport system substrate-binding protein [Amycolatopsis xylanica]|uniref:Oligopeptide transport system substrate-binding protein n=1 Tax=Amycolatopsis xylanica TaxID=589385 RepID=A0A1H3MV99_9PSEU|nr:ABC transporter substrate-binding protein [Amycolatopsis xylanica]SDY80370.1 oligopeptide transport system substrate-binding protein [Amycolatopsis xylanica]
MRLAALLATALVLTGCSTATPPEPGVPTVGVGATSSLLPAELRDQTARMVAAALWTPLVGYDPATGKTTPAAAESVTSDDQVTWTVKLRPGTFHDGTPVTAQSYLDTWHELRLSQGVWPGASVISEMLPAKEITATDPATIKIVLHHPFGQVPALLASQALYPLPESVLKSKDWAGFALNPVGNGPFKLAARWNHGGELVKVAGTGKIKLKELDPETQYDQAKSGAIDLATTVPGSRHDAMHAGPHAMWALPGATYLKFPAQGRFADATVRHAFAMAVDRDSLEAGPLDHQVDPARSLLPPAAAPGERSGTCRPCTYDPAAAKNLLKQSGFTGATTLDGGGHWASILATQLQTTLGVGVGVKPGDGPSVVTLELLTVSPHEPLAALAKAAGYTDAGFAELLATADAAPAAESQPLYRLAENQLLRDLPVAPLWSGHGHAVWPLKVSGVKANPLTGVDLTSFSRG